MRTAVQRQPSNVSDGPSAPAFVQRQHRARQCCLPCKAIARATPQQRPGARNASPAVGHWRYVHLPDRHCAERAGRCRAHAREDEGLQRHRGRDVQRRHAADERQVLTLIDQAVADVQAWLGPRPPPELAAAAKVAAARRRRRGLDCSADCRATRLIADAIGHRRHVLHLGSRSKFGSAEPACPHGVNEASTARAPWWRSASTGAWRSATSPSTTPTAST